jgi:uncharacterized protein YndB with AHSA1/START domain
MAVRKRSAPRIPAIKITLDIPAPPARVFKALTDSKAIKAWSGAPGRVATRVGGRFLMWDGWNTGKVLARRAPTSLVVTWRKDDWPATTKDSLVTWSLEATAQGTRLLMVHSRLPSLAEYRDHKGGWAPYFLKPMVRYLKRS